jgi:hypothetical protein
MVLVGTKTVDVTVAGAQGPRRRQVQLPGTVIVFATTG